MHVAFQDADYFPETAAADTFYVNYYSVDEAGTTRRNTIAERLSCREARQLVEAIRRIAAVDPSRLLFF